MDDEVKMIVSNITGLKPIHTSTRSLNSAEGVKAETMPPPRNQAQAEQLLLL